jgi:hypothetical protein
MRVQHRVEHLICLACAVRLPQSLGEMGSLRCHDCIDLEVRLSEFLVRRQRRLLRAPKLQRAA